MKKEENKNTEQEQSNGEMALGVIQGLIGLALLIYGVYILFFR